MAGSAAQGPRYVREAQQAVNRSYDFEGFDERMRINPDCILRSDVRANTMHYSEAAESIATRSAQQFGAKVEMTSAPEEAQPSHIAMVVLPVGAFLN